MALNGKYGALYLPLQCNSISTKKDVKDSFNEAFIDKHMMPINKSSFPQ